MIRVSKHTLKFSNKEKLEKLKERKEQSTTN